MKNEYSTGREQKLDSTGCEQNLTHLAVNKSYYKSLIQFAVNRTLSQLKLNEVRLVAFGMALGNEYSFLAIVPFPWPSHEMFEHKHGIFDVIWLRIPSSNISCMIRASCLTGSTMSIALIAGNGEVSLIEQLKQPKSVEQRHQSL